MQNFLKSFIIFLSIGLLSIFLCIKQTLPVFAQKETKPTALFQIDSLQISLQKKSETTHELQIKAQITEDIASTKTSQSKTPAKPKKVKKTTFYYLVNIGVILSFVVLSILFIVLMLRVAKYVGYIPEMSDLKREKQSDKNRIEQEEILREANYDALKARTRLVRIRRMIVICIAFFLEFSILQEIFIRLVELVISHWNTATDAVAAVATGSTNVDLSSSFTLQIDLAENVINQMLVIIPFFFTAYLIDMFLSFFVWFNILAASPDESLPPGESKVPRLIRFLVSIILYAIALVAIAAVLYPQALFGVIASLGASGAIGAFFAKEPVKRALIALSLNINKQYKRGDLIEINGLKGRIIDIGWRAVKLRTAEGNEIIIPNTTLLESNVIEYPYRSIKFTLSLDANISPQSVKEKLLRSVHNSDLIMSQIKPNINLVELQENTATYSIEVFTKHDNEEAVRGEILSSIWYTLRREGWVKQPVEFEIAYPEALARELIDNAVVTVTDDNTGESRVVKIFAPFSDEEVQEIAKKAKFLRFGYPERIVVQGDNDTDLYIVAQGTLQVFQRQSDGTNQPIMVEDKEGKKKPLELKAGNFFGEMSLLGGEPRSATVRAMNDVLVCQISQEIIKPAIEKNPEIIKELSEILAERKMANLKNSSDYNQSLSRKQKEAILKTLINDMFSIFIGKTSKSHN
ncbi:MAG: mechanosensitive ion channel family protein [Microscillaceae bacterium]|nr:mechanosensitive ion channel family protein [Microscillaceae bacterium]MDW8459815.1 mechanosensitive ion channel family protein [Cytophagales bacterium]